MADSVGPVTPGRIWSNSSMTVTSRPHMSAKATAISRPMKPEPMMATDPTPPAATDFLMASAASRLSTVCTPGRSMPAMGSLRGLLPVAMTSLS